MKMHQIVFRLVSNKTITGLEQSMDLAFLKASYVLSISPSLLIFVLRRFHMGSVVSAMLGANVIIWLSIFSTWENPGTTL